MREWTEQEEQEMIARAKTGDPEANYELSLWALQRGEEEPEEPRWNKLAAKCLVKAAEAGYGPAQEKMAGILQQAQPPQNTRSRTSRQEQAPEPVRLSEARRPASRQAQARQTTARRPAPEPEPEYDDYEEDGWDGGQDDDEEDYAPRRGGRPGRRAPRFQMPFSSWGDRQWRTMEMICIGVCAALLILIAIMLFTGRGRSAQPTEPTTPGVPAANVANPAEPGENGAASGENTVAGDYPSDDIKAQILAAELDFFPDEADYVTAPKTAKVSVGNVSLRLRTGPNVTYPEIAYMDNDSVVSVYAERDDWKLVLYNGDTWGWCSGQYLIITEGDTGVG